MAKPTPHGTNNGYTWYKCRCAECVAAHKSYRRSYYEANREKAAEHLRRWRKTNPEKTSDQARRWRQANPEKVAENNRTFREANPEYFQKWRDDNPDSVRRWAEANPERAAEIARLGDHRYRARKRAAFVEDVPRLEIFARDNWECGIPGCLFPGIPASIDVPHNDPLYASIDHVIPLSKGGTHERKNLTCSHLRCNVAKGNRVGIA